MKNSKNIIKDVTYGQISLAAFLICAITGVLIAIPYDVNNPLLSLSTIMILNPTASFIRNLHFWSAQGFLIFTLIHIWDHFNRTSDLRIKKGVWLRLTIGVIILFLAMLTGFLLKGDADTQQAWRILDSLINEIPTIGSLIAYSLLGTEDSLQLVYVHHIATFTIFLAIITFEHSRKLWPIYNAFFIVLLGSVILSYFFTAPLHDGINPSVKGPWYFVGFQEVLHWLTMPWISILIIILFLTLIYIIPYAGKQTSFLSKRSLLIITILYILLTISGMFFRGENWGWIWPWQANYSHSVMNSFKTSSVTFTPDFSELEISNSGLVDGKKESCIVCHQDVVGFTASHSPEAIGCFSCHGGNPFDGSKEGAHQNMILVPGNFADADISCGTTNCHPDITRRKSSNLMSNLSGMISVDRFVFNEQDNPDILTDVHHLANTAADEHLRNLCVTCHLDNPKTESGPVTEKSRGGGCLACHVNYDQFATTAWLNHKADVFDTTYLKYHPSISMQVTNQHCFGCHSRSARISTSYEGWHETDLVAENVLLDSNYRLVEETRVFKFVQEDVHHKLGLSCIDCHNSYEVMGDGNYYAHQENQNTISCSDCHFDGEPATVDSKELDNESAKIASMRFGANNEKKFLVTNKRGVPLVNTKVRNDSNFFFTKNEGVEFVLSPPNEVCTKGNAHDNLSCASCHSSWAPSCIGCHNEYDPNERGYDMIANREKMGSWVEYVGEYNHGLPALGVRKDGENMEVIPVVPGMVLTIDVGSFSKDLHDSLIFHRLFAPSAPHTTVTKGRDCKSCHNNPVALGYGKGKLTFDLTNHKWSFDSHYQNNPNDNLPEDSWVGFMDDRLGEKVSTRSNLFPFSVEDQKRILTVGACLTCHDDNSTVAQQSLINFDSIIGSRSSRCIIPDWN